MNNMLHKNQKYRNFISKISIIFICLFLLTVTDYIQAEDMPPLPPNAPIWDFDSLFKTVRPLTKPLNGRFPIFVWNLPTFNYSNSDKMRWEISELGRRGINVWPHIQYSKPETLPDQIKLAKMAQEMGQPIYLVYSDCEQPGGQKKLWPESRMWLPPRKDGSYGGDKSWPILPLADSSYAADQMREILKKFKQAGIKVSGLMSDQENLPYPWNGIYSSQKTEAARKYYKNPEVLKNSNTFKQYALNLRAKILREIFVVPLQELWPQAVYGNYGDVLSWGNHPFVVANNCAFPEGVKIADKISQPVCYAHTGLLLKNIPADMIPSQKEVDAIFFHLMLRTASTALINKRPDIFCIPWISKAICHINYEKRVRMLGLSSHLFKEFIRHCFLRGADGFCIYNCGFYKGGYLVSPQRSFESMDDTVAVYNELLPYREFLEKGEPMTFDVPHMNWQGGIWSGLALKDKRLIRVASLGNKLSLINVPTFPNKTTTLEAPPEGRYYLILKGKKPISLN
jgi:hypothetical protein